MDNLSQKLSWDISDKNYPKSKLTSGGTSFRMLEFIYNSPERKAHASDLYKLQADTPLRGWARNLNDGHWITYLLYTGRIERLERGLYTITEKGMQDLFAIRYRNLQRNNKTAWQTLEDNFDRIETDIDENKFYYKGDYIHRLDGPAIEWSDGDKSWYQNGVKHREDGPAVDFNRFKSWWINGKRHRLDGPAIEYRDGRREWWIDDVSYTEEEFNEKVKELNKTAWKVLDDNFDRVDTDEEGNKRYFKGDKYHRLDGPAIELISGAKAWFVNNKRHRLDGPAIEWKDGDKEWYQNDKRHRLDGPAIEFSDGSKSWYIDGDKYTEKRFNEKVKELNKTAWQNSNIDVDNLAHKLYNEYQERVLDNYNRSGESISTSALTFGKFKIFISGYVDQNKLSVILVIQDDDDEYDNIAYELSPNDALDGNSLWLCETQNLQKLPKIILLRLKKYLRLFFSRINPFESKLSWQSIDEDNLVGWMVRVIHPSQQSWIGLITDFAPAKPPALDTSNVHEKYIGIFECDYYDGVIEYSAEEIKKLEESILRRFREAEIASGVVFSYEKIIPLYKVFDKKESSKTLTDKQLNDLNNLLSIQGDDGNWNFDSYMHGMFNGMELMDSIVDGREPQYKDAPKSWHNEKVSWQEQTINIGDTVFLKWPERQELFEDIGIYGNNEKKDLFIVKKISEDDSIIWSASSEYPYRGCITIELKNESRGYTIFWGIPLSHWNLFLEKATVSKKEEIT